MAHLTYRPDIDGLRAIAVAIVVFFHVGLGCPGGFVGVDVFFVISGFLITSIIVRDISDGCFSLATFWDRRIRRIVPPLFVVTVSTLVVGWLILLPTDMQDLSRSALSQVMMGANIYFWKTTGYFGGAADQKPLLHMWSLAVEEQFYLFFPLCLVVMKRIAIRRQIMVLGCAAVVSFGISSVSVLDHPAATFYLLPTRMWELLLGTLLALTVSSSWPSRKVGEICGWTGLLMIMGSSFCYSTRTVFPGIAAMIPCVGTAMVISAGNSGQASISRFLSWKPLVFIGLISYSLYLWHWPVLVFAKYWVFSDLSLIGKFAIVAGSVMVAYSSWRFVESPFRGVGWKLPVPSAVVFGGAAGALLVIGFFAQGLSLPDMQPLMTPAVVQFSAALNTDALFVDNEIVDVRSGNLRRLGSVGRGGTDLLVWGDSHAMAALPVVDKLCVEYGASGLAVTHGDTAPLENFVWQSPFSLGESSPAFADAVIEMVKERQIQWVLLIGRWSQYRSMSTNHQTIGKFHTCLQVTLQRLHRSGAQVAIMLEVPRQEHVVPKWLARESLLNRRVDQLGVSVEQYQRDFAEINAEISRIAHGQALVFDPLPYFRNEDDLCVATRNGFSLYHDDNHLTVQGALELKPLLQPLFDRLKSSPPNTIVNKLKQSP